MIYQVGGSLQVDALSYVQRAADTELYLALQQGKLCYVLNCRQMGKSSLLVQTRHWLQQEGFRCAAIDMTTVGSETVTPEQWYKGIATELWRGFQLYGKWDLKAWWRDQENLSVVQKLSQLVDELLLNIFPSDRLVIFVDEIDSILSLHFSVDDFFALIRYFYNERAINPAYNRLTFAIFGVATPSDLIQDRTRTPFNIGKAIELQGLKLEDAQPLIQGLTLAEGDPQAVLRAIIDWTNGQPFLTQKLCQLVADLSDRPFEDCFISAGTEAAWVERLVQEHIIQNWEIQDEPEHLRTIRDRIERNGNRAARLLGVYQQILQNGEVPLNESREQQELLLAGLVVKQRDCLIVKNRIYEAVFDRAWVNQQLAKLRPYSQNLEAWLASDQQDESRLLRGQALDDALYWSRGKSLSNLDYQFLAASQELDRQETRRRFEVDRLKEVQLRLTIEQKSARRQRVFLVVLSFALAIALAFAGLASSQYQQAMKNQQLALQNEIQAIATSANALHLSGRELEGLLAGLRSQHKLQNLTQQPPELRQTVELALRQSAYRVTESNRLLGHQSEVNGVDFSPDGELIVSGSTDKTVKLWQQDGALLKTLVGHTAAVWTTMFSSDGELIASSSEDQTIKLWRRDGTLLKTLTGHTSTVWYTDFSPDGQLLASASADGTIKLWSRDGQLLRTLDGHTEGVNTVVFSSDGKQLMSAGNDSTIRIWGVDGTLLKTIEDPDQVVGMAIFSPDNQQIISVADNGTLKFWSRDGALLKSIDAHPEGAWSAEFSPDGRWLVTSGNDQTIKLWNRDGVLLKTLVGHTQGIWSAVFSPDGQTIISCSWDHTIRTWQLNSPMLTTLRDHDDGVRGVGVSPDGQLIASASFDNTIKLWRPDGSLVNTLQGHTGTVNTVAFSSGNPAIASAADDATVRLWSQDGRLLFTFDQHESEVQAVAFSPDGQLLASGGWDNDVKLWKSDGTLLKTLKGHTTTIWFIAFSPDGQFFASASGDSTVKLWRRDGSLVATLQGHTSTVSSVAFSPDSQLLASASNDGTLKLWRRDGSLTQTIVGQQNEPLLAVAFSSDGRVIASGSENGLVQLWHLDGTLIATLSGHDNRITGLAFDPNGQFLASASQDKTVVLWQLNEAVGFDRVYAHACNWVKNYLQHSTDEEERSLCTQ
ncbi:AAA-like domain-containing protein [Oscillatoria sp. FACHB-1407]|uniref:WD40 domain-containing protein n=1 Tax=Oscillatoria sp. FACHB-1407 TaxID=2692847 RepID=UPI001687E342|nr:AAA-like domain-containing protein [Oscillatoria sp. FACHB-1407]MBD2459528.1 AAA-like domain-containing protein [Oscillatoria sp. FACHB-1407]